MALQLAQADFTYNSMSGGYTYSFTVVFINDDNVSVRNITTPYGLIQDAYSSLPQSVIADIRIATLQVLQIMATSSINGIADFTAQSSLTITFDSPLDNTDYRVVFSVQDFVPVRVVSKTITGFTIETGITYTGSVGYDVFI